MAQPAQVQEERRSAERLALRLSATMRDGTRSRVKVPGLYLGARVQDASTVIISTLESTGLEVT